VGFFETIILVLVLYSELFSEDVPQNLSFGNESSGFDADFNSARNSVLEAPDGTQVNGKLDFGCK
jgi:hypothetical protein